MPPGVLHQQVSSALASWQLDSAEALLREVDGEATAADRAAAPLTSLARAWADTLRAELLVRRLRLAGYSLLGDPLVDGGPEQDGPLDLHGDAGPLSDVPVDRDTRSESATHAALAISLVRSARAAFDAQDDDLQRAAGLARHARIELLSRRVDAAMDEAVEAASLLDPGLAPSPLLVHTLGSLAAVLADLELMPLALDYQRRAADVAAGLAGRTTGDDDPADPELLAGLAGETATRLAALCAEVGEALLEDGSPDAAAPHFTEARDLAVRALAQLPPTDAGVLDARVVHGWALVGLGEHATAVSVLRPVVGRTGADRALLASAELGLGRALRRSGEPRAADDHLATALALATEHGLPRLRRAALRELCTLHAELDDAARALPYLQAYLADELDRVDERRTRWVELFGRRKSLLETERAAGQLRRQAYEDPLTHLPNRRYAEARLDGLLSAGSSPALAVVDIDRFKAINDAAGHPGGDAVLRAVGQLLVEGCRGNDEVCRWAGDEFVIVLPDTTAEQAERAMERIRRSIAAHDWSALGVSVPVRISVGIAQAARGDDRRTLFAAADGVLYDAKRGGRDRVVRLSGVTQTRAGEDAAETIEGTAGTAVDTPITASAEVVATPIVGDVTVSPQFDGPDEHDDPADAAGGFAALLVEPDDQPGEAPAPAQAVPVEPAPVHTVPVEPADDERAHARNPLDELFGGPVRRPAGRRIGPAEPTPAMEPAAVSSTPVPPPPAPVSRELGLPAGPDVIWGTGRSTEQVLALVREARRDHPDHPAVVVRASADTLVALASEHDAYTTMDAAAMSAAVGPVPEPRGRVGVLCASSGDTPIAAEAAFVARISGTEVVRVDDVGGNRIRPLLADRSLLTDVDCLVVVAGLDAALASVVSGLTEVPVVAVPTSAGAGASFGGFGALLTMLNSAAPGVVVSNIDNGWSAGVFAARIARRTAR
ncbi:diguanylate cyclase [Modestobacter sp. VKM Ac-2986]|uniref:diguanylate cyclase domain-containing protein n=1 Tax=Modestobacter sp. VKM Ac-2986 TaxID=3004140 RepID=UPI0022AB55FD|nr:diguanylate cyclase [Modestobacter sp. VKM Ac-2986]MCZ2830953.1 diguanylate cyclase [Modestobacter sp. VKM Ac-2986]